MTDYEDEEAYSVTDEFNRKENDFIQESSNILQNLRVASQQQQIQTSYYQVQSVKVKKTKNSNHQQMLASMIEEVKM